MKIVITEANESMGISDIYELTYKTWRKKGEGKGVFVFIPIPNGWRLANELDDGQFFRHFDSESLTWADSPFCYSPEFCKNICIVKEKPKVKEMTVAEISEALGYEVKVTK